MIRTLRALFLGRSRREKVLLLLFIVIGLLWWASLFANRAALFMREQRSTTSRLKEQEMWIQNQAFIEENAKMTAARLDPAKTLNANQLAAAVSQLANEAGLTNTRSTGLNTQISGQFAVHSLDYTIQNADWQRSLLTFYTGLQQRAPYIAIDRFVVTAPPNNPAQLNVVMRLVSVEIVR